jgi:hypothetical protein
MGRRSRKRIGAPTSRTATPHAGEVPARPVERAAPVVRRSRRDAAPTPPWGAFPLVELCALAAIVLGVWGILRGGRGGAVLLVAAALLGSVAGLEVAIREHLSGYRSHTLVLSATLAVATMAALFFAQVERTTMWPIAAVVFIVGFFGWRALFKRRSGGASFRVR